VKLTAGGMSGSCSDVSTTTASCVVCSTVYNAIVKCGPSTPKHMIYSIKVEFLKAISQIGYNPRFK
jgi:hypothetical protein